MMDIAWTWRSNMMCTKKLLLVVLTLCAFAGVAACGTESTEPTDDGGGTDTVGADTADVSVPPFAGACAPDFGEATPGELSALVGQAVVVEGRILAGQPVKVAPQECVGIGGLAAIHLRTKADGTWLDDVQLVNADLEGIFCGCHLAQDEDCLTYPPGAKMRLKGTLETNPTIPEGEACNQKSCVVMAPEASCFVDGCSDDAHCPAGTCNVDAYQCRGQAGGPCDKEVGCDPADGAAQFCVDKTPSDPMTSDRQCSPVGDGTEDSVCAEDADCTECPDCECFQNICTFLAPIG
jgi:hypothetical protein